MTSLVLYFSLLRLKMVCPLNSLLFVSAHWQKHVAKKFRAVVACKAAAIQRQLTTKIYVSQTSDSASLLDITQYSHRYLLATISECLTAVAYGGAASILAPIQGWTLE